MALGELDPGGSTRCLRDPSSPTTRGRGRSGPAWTPGIEGQR